MQEDRVEMGNAIFIQMKDYCRLAKAAWRTLDAAKYNDYLVYDTPSGSGTGNDTSIDNEYVATVEANTVKTVAAIDEEVVLIMTNTGSVPLKRTSNQLSSSRRNLNPSIALT